MALSVDQALAKAKHLTKQGYLAKAEVLYNSVLTKFPKNRRATKGLLALKGHQNQRAAQPDDNQLQALITADAVDHVEKPAASDDAVDSSDDDGDDGDMWGEQNDSD